jgi:N,N'-diacetyllegionaminate synthase
LKNKKTYIIAEIGINHNGSIKIAKKLISIAKKCRVNAVKFQTFITENLIQKKELLMPYQKKNINQKINQFQMLKKCELNFNQLKNLKKYSKKNKLDFISTPYDFESCDTLIKLNLKVLKIASTDITNVPLIRYLLAKKIKLILSSGATNERDLEKIMKLIKINSYRKKLSLLHCISCYPANIKKLNLNVINALKKKYKINIGFSDHTNNNLTGAIAVACGAKIIEKHITLSKKMIGPDHKASLEPKDFKIYVENIRIAEKMVGIPKKILTADEVIIKKRMQKSIYTSEKIKKNDKFNIGNLKFMRPATGISPMYIDKVLKSRAKSNIESNKILKFKDLK